MNQVSKFLISVVLAITLCYAGTMLAISGSNKIGIAYGVKECNIEEVKQIEVKQGETFKISLGEALNPFYDWILKSYDPEYVEFVDKGYQAPPSEIVGVTIRVFKFKALRKGETQMVFTHCELDIEGNVKRELETAKYKVRIT